MRTRITIIKENRLPGKVRLTEANRFSANVNPRDKESIQSLHNWLNWFEERRIKAILAEKGEYWAIYRNGLVEL